MTTEKYKYPTDELFRRKAAKIADACMGKENVIHPDTGNCPLGVACGKMNPGANIIQVHGLLNIDESASFVNGFDGFARPVPEEDDAPCVESFYRLGYAYRQRFTRLRP